MPIEYPAVDTSPVSMTSVQAPDSTFDERWAAWQARGAAHDRDVQRRIRIAVPILLAVAAIAYVLFAF